MQDLRGILFRFFRQIIQRDHYLHRLCRLDFLFILINDRDVKKSGIGYIAFPDFQRFFGIGNISVVIFGIFFDLFDDQLCIFGNTGFFTAGDSDVVILALGGQDLYECFFLARFLFGCGLFLRFSSFVFGALFLYRSFGRRGFFCLFGLFSSRLRFRIHEAIFRMYMFFLAADQFCALFKAFLGMGMSGRFLFPAGQDLLDLVTFICVRMLLIFFKLTDQDLLFGITFIIVLVAFCFFLTAHACLCYFVTLVGMDMFFPSAVRFPLHGDSGKNK